MSHGNALIQTLFEERGRPRGDELATHGSDVYSCLRATAYRRRGMKPIPLTKRDLAKFAIGHGYELEVAQTLRDAGHQVRHDPKTFVVSAFGLDIIHPDILVDGAMLIECKTTDGGANEPQKINGKPNPNAGQPKAVSPHHAIQVAMGALACSVNRAVVLVKHAGIGERGHEEVAYEVVPEEYREIIEERARAVVALTGPEMPLPDAEPPPREIVPFDSCGYCRWAQCSRNPKHQAAFEDEADD